MIGSSVPHKLSKMDDKTKRSKVLTAASQSSKLYINDLHLATELRFHYQLDFDEMLEYLEQVFVEYPKIEELSLFRCHISEKQLLQFVLRLPEFNLTRLLLVESCVTTQVALQITSVLPLTKLKKLDLSGNDIGNVLELVKNCTSLESLSLYKTGIGSRFCQELSECLPHTSLVELDIGGNHLCWGMRYIIAVLPQTKIRSLLIRRTHIYPRDLTTLFELLSSNKLTLNRLDLGHNTLTDGTIKGLPEMLRKNIHLNVLVLNGNLFTGDGFHCISQGIRQNNYLEEVHLQEMSTFRAPIINYFRDAVRTHRTMKKVLIGTFPHVCGHQCPHHTMDEFRELELLNAQLKALQPTNRTKLFVLLCSPRYVVRLQSSLSILSSDIMRRLDKMLTT